MIIRPSTFFKKYLITSECVTDQQTSRIVLLFFPCVYVVVVSFCILFEKSVCSARKIRRKDDRRNDAKRHFSLLLKRLVQRGGRQPAIPDETDLNINRFFFFSFVFSSSSFMNKKKKIFSFKLSGSAWRSRGRLITFFCAPYLHTPRRARLHY